MSVVYRKRWELVFLVKHAKGPQMSIDSAAKYLKQSKGWAINILNHFEEYGNVDFSENKGRTKVTTEKQDIQMVNLALADKPMTSKQIAHTMHKKGVKVSHDTVNRRLKERNCRYGAVLKKPLLKTFHIERRLIFAQENFDRDWSRVIFTDESTFELSFGVTRAWQVRGDPRVTRVVKHPPKVNVWGCFSEKGFGRLVIIHGILESKQMVRVYKEGLLPSAKMFYGTKNRNWHLLEDNDPKHKSRLCNSWKAQNEIQVIEWPSQSPDLNPIENVWALIKTKIKQKNLHTVQGLIRAIKYEWRALSIEYAKKLAQSCVNRCHAVIENKGDWIPY